ncbi:MAG TPA: AAA family ATPase [Candidatus Saccharimonadales bacterium]|jgi:(p)ppGpp synthase/HD superfamily hydrolase|nr:AAA family ATPase [Candidatus Saccharimonadales bacterium]
MTDEKIYSAMLQSGPKSEPIRSWCASIIEQVKALSPDAALVYGDAERAQHFFTTAKIFEAYAKHDRALAQAGFLHGVTDILRLRNLGEEVDPAVLEILEDRKSLRMIDKPDTDVPQRLTKGVLPQMRHARSAVLLVVEQLLHLDPMQELFHFSHEFHLSPGRVPDQIKTIPAGFGDLKSHLDYLKLVVVPTATFFGLWFHKNLCEDLCLYHANNDRFRELAAFVLDKVASGEPESRAAIVRKNLKLTANAEVFWEWHHLASLDRRLAHSLSHENIAQPLSSCGMVTVVCPTREDCYQAVSELHLSSVFRHQTLDIRDTLGVPQITGYEAFHTVLTPVKSDEKSIRVRVICKESQQKRNELFTLDRFEKMQKQLESRRDGQLQVFANDGRAISLPFASTVLNFAYEIHHDFVALAHRAYVNGMPVDLLHPLRERDVVRLEISTEPRPLPPEWEKKVPLETVSKIRREFNACYKPSLIKSGRERLRKKLKEYSIEGIENPEIYDDATLDSFLEEAVAVLSQTEDVPLPMRNATWWLRCIHLLEPTDGHAKIKKDVIDLWDRLLLESAERFKKSSRVSLESFSFPRNMEGNFNRLVLCEDCAPLPGQSVVGQISRKRLVVHLAKCRSAGDAKPIEWMQHFTRGQYFVIEMINRQGMAAELLTAIATRSVDIVDIVTSSLGPSWAVMRIHVQPLGPALVRDLTLALSQVPGVIRVLGPEEEIVPVLEGPLPPREYPRYSLFTQQSPFFHGPPINDDQYFYGRERELARLRRLFQQVRAVDAVSGLLAFVKGPKKTGKTSLVNKFLRELRRAEYECTTVNLTATSNESWLRLKRRLHDALQKERLRLRAQDEDANGSKTAEPLPSLLASFRNDLRRTLVLIIDEATSMFLKTATAGQENRLVDFIRLIERTPGVLLIWVGPELPAEVLPAALVETIRVAQDIRVPGLEQLEVKHLLQAKNWSHRGLNVEVEDAVLLETFRFTGGNAYWCNILADELFGMRQARNGKVHFQLAQLKRAKTKLIENADAFCDRVEDFCAGTNLEGSVTAILRALARTGRGMRVEDLVRSVQEVGLNINETAVRRILDHLRAKGSVEHSEPTWQVEPPALAEHVERWFPS